MGDRIIDHLAVHRQLELARVCGRAAALSERAQGGAISESPGTLRGQWQAGTRHALGRRRGDLRIAQDPTLAMECGFPTTHWRSMVHGGSESAAPCALASLREAALPHLEAIELARRGGSHAVTPRPALIACREKYLFDVVFIH